MSNLIKNVRDRRDRGDKGFSLIELLVVVAILAILAAIAIPLFLNQKNKSYQATATADVNTLAKEMATYLTGNSGATTASPITLTGATLTGGGVTIGNLSVSPGSAVTAFVATSAAGSNPAWCVMVTNNSQKAVYNSATGLDSTKQTNCAANGVAS
jgi:prepilin-type N-terminal cleavage/methylation domain-containing protein